MSIEVGQIYEIPTESGTLGYALVFNVEAKYDSVFLAVATNVDALKKYGVHGAQSAIRTGSFDDMVEEETWSLVDVLDVSPIEPLPDMPIAGFGAVCSHIVRLGSGEFLAYDRRSVRALAAIKEV